jgi:DNA modification methylase
MLSGGGLRTADGKVKRKTGAGDEIQSHHIPDSVVRVMRHKGAISGGGSHPAVFAVGLPIFIMESYTDIGDMVFEPFCGSGTTVLAAEKTGRVARAVELAPHYVDIAVARWNAGFPDRPAILEATGQTFAALSAERQDHGKPNRVTETA